jgi:hypothetical protein
MRGKEKQLQVVQDGGLILSSIGKRIVEITIQKFNKEAFKEGLERNLAEVNKVAFKNNNHRVCFNTAVVLTGLDFLSDLLNAEDAFKGKFEFRFAQARSAVLKLDNQIASSVTSEAAKVIATLALISHTEEPGSEFGLREGMDYVHAGPALLDLRIDKCFVKYRAWCKRKGQTPLYDSPDACTYGLAHHNSVVDKVCTDSPLKDSAQAMVFRFNVRQLSEEGVEPFRVSRR